MKIPGFQLVRVIEFRVDAAPVRDVWKNTGQPALSNGVAIVPFSAAYAGAVAKARSPSEMDAFSLMADRGESGWLALDPSERIVGHCWRIDNRGDGVVRSSVPIDPGWAYMHYGWVDPSRRGQGILPALMCSSMLQALAISGWSVRGFSADIAPENTASQRSVSKLGFAPVHLFTSVRVAHRWFQVQVHDISAEGEVSET